MIKSSGLSVWMVVLSLVVLGGCSTIFGSTAADRLVPVSEENKLGDEMKVELERELELSDDEELVTYIRQLGNTMVNQATVPEGIEFEFFVVDDDDMVNAFAIPGGGIYVFTGLILAMDDEAELAGVMGHEVAHVTRRHIAQRLVAIYSTEIISQMAFGEEPGLLRQLVTAVAQQGFMLSYSRANERDADYYGVQYMVDAGYDPRGLIDFFEKLSDAPQPPAFLSTHPAPTERMQNIEEHIAEFDRVPNERHRDRFQEMKARIQ